MVYKNVRNVYSLILSDWKNELEIHSKSIFDNPQLIIDKISPSDSQTKRFDRINVHPWRSPSWYDHLVELIEEKPI